MASAPTETTRDAGASAELSFDATVPRQLAHKRALGEVFLTDSRPIGDDRFQCAGQLPRANAFFNDCAASWHDPLLVLEAARQAGLLVAHRYLGVPLGSQFLVTHIYVTARGPDACRRGPEAAEAVFDVAIPKRHERDGVLTGVDIDQEIALDGTPSHTAGGAFLFLDADQYRALREQIRASRSLDGGGPPPTPPAAGPELVARIDGRNVVISEPTKGGDAFAASVIVDRDHPSLFDHPLDHVPGTVLLEAYRQMAVASAALAHELPPAELFLASCRARFNAFAELELPIACEAVVGEPREDEGGRRVTVELTLRQPDMELSKATVELAAPAA